MADDKNAGATPPGRGEQTHEVMRASAMHVTPGPGPDHEPIPGERDPDNLTGLEPGVFGGGGYGAHVPRPERELPMDDETLHDREIEGGGGEKERR
jgi:hypothetical protein